jgi:hypothetical protein
MDRSSARSRTALNLAAARLRHIAGTAWSSKLKDQRCALAANNASISSSL